MPSNTMVPSVMRQPGRAKPMAASPMVDLPAPDSPIRPSTSPRFRVRSTPLTIGCQTPSLLPSILRPLDLEKGLALDALASQCSSRKSACLVQEPVDHEIDADRQERDGNGGIEGRRNLAEGPDRKVMSVLFSATIEPQSAVGGWMPTPRKDSAEMVRKTKQKRRPNSVISGGRMLGRISLKMIQPVPSPRSLRRLDIVHHHDVQRRGARQAEDAGRVEQAPG